MRTITKLFAVGVVAFSAVLISATAAQAAPATVSSAPSAQATPDSAGKAALSWPAGTFDGGSDITVVYEGKHAAPVITTSNGAAASLRSTATGITLINAGHAALDGSLAVSLQFTADATGQYELTFSDPSGHTVVGDIQAMNPATDGGSASLTNDAPAVGSLGSGYMSLLVIWTAIGLVALLAGYVVVRITVRKQHELRNAASTVIAGGGVQPVTVSN